MDNKTLIQSITAVPKEQSIKVRATRIGICWKTSFEDIVSIRKMMYERFVGKLGKRNIVRVTCENDFCVNPEHLYVKGRVNPIDPIPKVRRKTRIRKNKIPK